MYTHFRFYPGFTGSNTRKFNFMPLFCHIRPVCKTRCAVIEDSVALQQQGRIAVFVAVNGNLAGIIAAAAARLRSVKV
jgi:hypothetical protein